MAAARNRRVGRATRVSKRGKKNANDVLGPNDMQRKVKLVTEQKKMYVVPLNRNASTLYFAVRRRLGIFFKKKKKTDVME